ncbi:MAG: hypothetical protein GEU99_07435 [Luteitalea sp.]|nr:hypothetical protein [Luteitalea sp.]
MKSRVPSPCIAGGTALLILMGGPTTLANAAAAASTREQPQPEQQPAPPQTPPRAAPTTSLPTPRTGSTLPLQPLTGSAQGTRLDSPYEPSARPAQEVIVEEEAAGRLRYQVQNMESMLVNAVQHAADRLTRRMRTVSPDVVMLTGTPRARGVMLDGYGAFFNVEVPAMSPSINWSLRILAQKYLGVENALTRLRRSVTTLDDPKARADAELALQTIEIQVRPPQSPSASYISRDTGARGPTTPVSASSVEPQPDAASPAATNPTSDASVEATSAPLASNVTAESVPDELLRNPSEAYEREVKGTLVDTVLDYAGTIPVGPNEWFTVAARDADQTMAPAGGQAVTVILRISGADLGAFRAGRLSRDEARQRVEIREF